MSNIKMNGIAIEHLDHDEAAELHDHVAFAMRSAGLKGPSLDEAIAAAFSDALCIIERERGMAEKRRETIKEVGP